MLIMSVSAPILGGTGIFWRFYSTYRTPALQANPLTPLAPYWTSFDAVNKMALDHATLTGDKIVRLPDWFMSGQLVETSGYAN